MSCMDGYLGGCKPGYVSHSLMCEPVSACRALRISASRTAPGGSNLASATSLPPWQAWPLPAALFVLDAGFECGHQIDDIAGSLLFSRSDRYRYP
jgi:hypothetical protein